MSNPKTTSRRKGEHVRIILEDSVSSRLTTGLERLHFVPRALPELNLAEVSTTGSFLGLRFDTPLLISSMTGGAQELEELNMRLAEAAQARRVPMGVGSQRAMLESDALADTYRVRRAAPDIPLLANLGAVQLNYGYSPDECRRAVEMIEADALILHLNALQEALQPEGDTRFAGLAAKIEAVVNALDVPVIAKEVGWGVSSADARLLRDAGVSAIDVAGAGGTSWSEVERHRNPSQQGREVAAAFAGWGIPTVTSLALVHQAVPEMELIASGGLRDGLDVAKVLALGASLAGFAGPLLRAAARSTADVVRLIDVLTQTLRLAMFAIGAPDLSSLRGTPALVELEEWR